MTARLDPGTALAYLLSLHTDVRAAAVLGPSGDVLAGDAALAGLGGGDGVLVAAGSGRSIVVRAGSQAVASLLDADMQAALDALDRG